MKLSFCKYWFKFSYLRLHYSAKFYRFLMRGNRRKTSPWTSAGGSSKRGTSSTLAPTSTTAPTTTFEDETTFLWWQCGRTSHCRAHAWTVARPIRQPAATGWGTKPGTGSSSIASKGNRFWRQRRRLEALFQKNVADVDVDVNRKAERTHVQMPQQMQL